MTTPAEQDRWKYRRRAVVFGIGLFSMLVVSLVAFGNPDNRIHELVVSDALWALTATIGLYVGAPIADDWLQTRNARKA